MAAGNDASVRSAASSTQVRHLQLVEFLHLVGGFWRGPTGHSAWMLTLSVLSVAIFEILVQLGINAWNGRFFDIFDGRRAGTIIRPRGPGIFRTYPLSMDAAIL
jgi:ABC-type uncharacterized transport system fused permease/ATPase subunit